MQPALTSPTLSEIGLSREALLEALQGDEFPSTVMLAAAALHAEEIERDILDVLERARTADLDDASANLLFCGLYLLAGRCLASGYRPCVAFLLEGGPRVDQLLGDVVTEDLAKILCGLFDGDTAPLVSLISASHIDPFVRSVALNAFAYLTFDGRIDRNFAENFLDRLTQDIAPEENMVWEGWASAAALLGLEHLFPRIQAACADERIPSLVADEGHYRRLLDEALSRPTDASRFAEENVGYIDDVVGLMDRWRKPADGGRFDGPDDDDRGFGGEPIRNPHRNVGRNDPCPCGSGKKYKKCCLRGED